MRTLALGLALGLAVAGCDCAGPSKSNLPTSCNGVECPAGQHCDRTGGRLPLCVDDAAPDGGGDAGMDAGPTADGGADAGSADAGNKADAGGGADAGQAADAGSPDGGSGGCPASGCPAGEVCDAVKQACVGIFTDLVITAPASGGFLHQTVTFSATLTLHDPSIAPPAEATIWGLAQVLHLPRTTQSGLLVNYEGSWDTTLGQDGSYTIHAEAGTGLPGSIASTDLLVEIDNTPPLITTMSPFPTSPRDLQMAMVTTVVEPNLAGVPTISVDGAAPIPMKYDPSTRTWNWLWNFALQPFPWFEHTFLVEIVASDQAGNLGKLDVQFPTSRQRWYYPVWPPAPRTGVAVTGDLAGYSYFGVAAATDNLRRIDYQGSPYPGVGGTAWKATVGSGPVTAAPVVGTSWIWVAGSDGKLFGVDPTASPPAVAASCGAGTSAGAGGAPSLSSGSPEAAYAGTGAGELWRGSAGAACGTLGFPEGVSTATAVNRAGQVYAATAGTAASLRRVFDAAGALSEDWSAALPAAAKVPFAIDGADAAILALDDGRLARVSGSATGSATTVASLAARPRAPVVVAANGDTLVGLEDGTVHRLSSTGAEQFSPVPAFSAAVTGLLLAETDMSGVSLYVTTADGFLHALGGAGGEVWAHPLSATGAALSFPNIDRGGYWTMPSLVVGSDDGNLYAIIVDKGLDPAAPWPKAHHDAANSGNAAFPLP